MLTQVQQPLCYAEALVQRFTQLSQALNRDAVLSTLVAATSELAGCKLSQLYLLDAGHNEIHYYAGNKVVLDAGMELTAKGGGSFLKLDPGGVTLSGATIKINSGGAAGTPSKPPAELLRPG